MKMPSRFLALATTLASLVMLTSSGCNNAQDSSGIAGSSQVSAEVSDVDVTTTVKSALRLDDKVKHFDIDVYTEKGIVRLTGVLDNQNQIDRVFTITRAIAGVRSIHDELTLKP